MIAAAGDGAGVVGIDGDRTVHLRLGLLIAMIEDMDAAEDDARAHVGIVEAERLVCHFLRAAQECGRQFRPAHRHGDIIGLGERRIGGGVVGIELDRAPQQARAPPH